MPRRFLALLATLVVALIVACRGDAPTGSARASAMRLHPASISFIPPVDSLAGYEVVDSAVINFTGTDDLFGELELGLVTDSTGPVAVEIEGMVMLDSFPIPIGEIVNSYGILWYAHVIPRLRASLREPSQLPELPYRLASPTPAFVPAPPLGFEVLIYQTGVTFDFLITTDSSDGYGDESVIPEPVAGAANTVRLVLDSTARGLVRVRWGVNGFAGITNYRPHQYPVDCLPIFGRCVAFPPDQRSWPLTGPGQEPRASGTFRVRVLRRASANDVDDLEVECPPSTLRASNVTCSITTANNSAFHLDSVISLPAGAESPIRLLAAPAGFAAGASLPVSGRLLVDTRLTVWGTVAGNTTRQSAFSNAFVTPRNFAGVVQLPTGLPPIDVSLDALRFGATPFRRLPDGADEWVEEGVAYLTFTLVFVPHGVLAGLDSGWAAVSTGGNPRFEPVVHVNPRILPGGDIYERQTANVAGQRSPAPYGRYCTKADMDTFYQEILWHEGAQVGPRKSHFAEWARLYRLPQNDAGVRIEPVAVESPVEIMGDLLQQGIDQATADIDAENIRIVHARDNVIQQSCKLRY